MAKTERDFDKTPYSLEEGRVCDYLQKLTPDIGCGDDPIGLLIASHAALRMSLERLKTLAEECLRRRNADGWNDYAKGM